MGSKRGVPVAVAVVDVDRVSAYIRGDSAPGSKETRCYLFCSARKQKKQKQEGFGFVLYHCHVAVIRTFDVAYAHVAVLLIRILSYRIRRDLLFVSFSFLFFLFFLCIITVLLISHN